MLKTLSIIFLAATTINLSDIDLAEKEYSNDTSAIQSEQEESLSEEIYEAPNFSTVKNEYTVEDLANFSTDDLIASDIMVYDENGQVYTGTILIQDFEGSGMIADDQFQEQEILISFLPEGQLVVCSEHPSALKVEVLNYRIEEISSEEF